LGPAVLAIFGANPNSQWGSVITVIVLGGGVTVLSVLGIQLSARFQMTIAGIEYIVLLVFSAIGIWAVFVAHRAGTVHPSLAWLSPNGVKSGGGLVAGMLIAVYLFTGWDTAVYLNEETERKEVNPGRAAIISVVVLGLFYTLLVVSLQGAASGKQMNAHSASALVFAAHQLVGSPWDKFMAVAVALSVIGSTQAFLIGTARIAYSMGSDHVIPRAFGKISDRFRTPGFGTIIFGLLTIVASCLYVFLSSVATAFNTVVTSVGVLFALFYAFTGFATSWYYRKLASKNLRNLIVIGALPSGGAVVLLWVAVKSVAQFSGPALWSLAGIGAAGVLMMLVAALVWRAPFFRLPRSTYESGQAGEVQ